MTNNLLHRIYLVGEDEERLDAVLPLARLSVRLSLVVPRVALAEERAFGVDAFLRANARHFVALVHVLAGLFVRHQLVA